MNPLDLRVGRIPSRDALGEDAALAQPGADGLYPVGTFRMRYAAQMFGVERIGDELQPECLPAEWQGSDIDLRTVAVPFESFFIAGSASSRL